MSSLIVVSAVSILAMLAALPGDFARRGGTGAVVGLGGVANAVVPGVAFWFGAHLASTHGFGGFALIVAAMFLGNVLADRIASRLWGAAPA